VPVVVTLIYLFTVPLTVLYSDDIAVEAVNAIKSAQLELFAECSIFTVGVPLDKEKACTCPAPPFEVLAELSTEELLVADEWVSSWAVSITPNSGAYPALAEKLALAVTGEDVPP
tara:strand:+ start:217 stop:561 length:345 start_codon:yes stop_codon:yes gene_type:complete